MSIESTSPKDELFQEALFRTLANNLQVGVYIIQNKLFQFINLYFQENAGYSETDLLAIDPASIIHPADRQTTKNNARNMLKGMRVSPYEYRLIMKDGRIKWMTETVTPIIVKGKRAILGNAMDITEQKEARESLLNLDALKSSILEAIPQAVAGLRNRKIIFANNAVEEIFGWQPEELIGKSVDIFYRNKKESDEIAQYFYTTLEHQRTFLNEFYCRHKDGRDILCRMRSSRIGEKLKDRRIVITYEDITEQRRSEEELANSREQLRNLSSYLQSVREKESTRIAREIHDDLGQSLSALQMDFSWLDSYLSGKDASLTGKVQRMRRLVDTTIDSVHRITTELRPILLDDLGLTAAIEWQVQEFQSRTGMRCNAKLDCKESAIEKDLATALFRIFQETMTNVARHADATLVRVQLSTNGQNVCLKVSDNGKGITLEELNDAKSFGIIGIRERVHLWGGDVKIIGKPGKGTTVVVQIPMQREKGKP
jgi:PAS domain S-box-containing protein